MPLSSHRDESRRGWRRAAVGAGAALILAAGGAIAATGPANAATGPATVSHIGTWAGERQTPGPAAKVSLTSPAEGTVLVSVCAIRMTAVAQAQIGTIDRVEFYINDQLVGSDAHEPYGIDVPPGHPALQGSTRHTAFAHVVTVSPAATADSTSVTFGYGPPPPALMVIACPSRVEVPAGGSTTVTFVTACGGAPGLLLTVSGGPEISVTPRVSPPGNREHRITVSAAPGSTGSVAWITANADTGGCMPATAAVTVS
ncbi:hypothetical protein SAMN05443287_103310 [Micromonospora phaseoli]|uniref:Ig-like domain (Group 3) n=1 Tax=Micromonospora phaseoli TaxID=1144548 RepID=A0A1H6WW63_9ACTN|nr:Ig-like domain-containing protein [Micromonospora phaseoli]PZW01940.1 hypothetical protein CLV64_102309 [Micromonospora phaseoli]GIJ80926.1 hypothetical protein Xph01_53580 [Micromonospora phaseoli]SEJ20106.1 hypothetical protein SAMN05443287_103310 [Micromonospora phaseoli]